MTPNTLATHRAYYALSVLTDMLADSPRCAYKPRHATIDVFAGLTLSDIRPNSTGMAFDWCGCERGKWVAGTLDFGMRQRRVTARFGNRESMERFWRR